MSKVIRQEVALESRQARKKDKSGEQQQHQPRALQGWMRAVHLRIGPFPNPQFCRQGYNGGHNQRNSAAVRTNGIAAVERPQSQNPGQCFECKRSWWASGQVLTNQFLKFGANPYPTRGLGPRRSERLRMPGHCSQERCTLDGRR